MSNLHAPEGKRRIFAHRGFSSSFPENTLIAFRAAAAAGARWLELDVDVIGDGTVVVCHDSTLDRTTNRSGSIYSLSAADLDVIDAGSWFGPDFEAERLPTLPQVVDLANELGLGLNVEIKGHETGAEGTIALLEGVAEQASRMKTPLIVSSFAHLALARIHELAPELPLACLWSNATLTPDWLSVMELVGASYVHAEASGLTPERIRLVRAAGFELNAWTVNEVGRANQLFNWGVNGIFTDYPDRFPTSN